MFRYTVIALLFILAGSRGTMFCTGGTCVTKPMSLQNTFAQLDKDTYNPQHRAVLPVVPECAHEVFSHILDYPLEHFTLPRQVLLGLFSLPDPTHFIVSTRPPRIP